MSIVTIEKSSARNRTATIRINKKENVVEKVIDYPPYTREIYHREVYWLKRLKTTGIVPEIISSDDSTYTITMQYAGEILSRKNKPRDVYEQLFHISILLMRHGCLYNDWKWGNFLVKDKKITIIDFSWCPRIVEDFSCGGVVETNLKNKPYGPVFEDVMEPKPTLLRRRTFRWRYWVLNHLRRILGRN